MAAARLESQGVFEFGPSIAPRTKNTITGDLHRNHVRGQSFVPKETLESRKSVHAVNDDDYGGLRIEVLVMVEQVEFVGLRTDMANVLVNKDLNWGEGGRTRGILLAV